MTPGQFKSAIAKLGLSQEGAGLWFGYSARQGQRWANEEAPVPISVARLIRLMLKYDLKPDDVK